MSDIITIPYIEGDGAGEDIWHASKEALEESVLKAYKGEKKIQWISLLAGEKALERKGDLLPEETLVTVKKHKDCNQGAPHNTSWRRIQECQRFSAAGV